MVAGPAMFWSTAESSEIQAWVQRGEGLGSRGQPLLPACTLYRSHWEVTSREIPAPSGLPRNPLWSRKKKLWCS